jgi:aspartyl/asparaginyl-tRNA synthetase
MSTHITGVEHGDATARTGWPSPDAQLNAVLNEPRYRLLTTIYADLVERTNHFYQARDIRPVLMPITVGSVSSPVGAGSDSLPVRISLFGADTYLADSMQFQLEFLLRHGLTGAYYVMPSFRGEDPDVTHLNQFFHSEAEIVGDLEAVMTLVEQYVAALADALTASRAADEIAVMAGGLDHLACVRRSPFPRITFDEALELLGRDCFTRSEAGSLNITRGGEARLIAHFGGVVWLTHPPQLSVPFYQRVDPDGRAECADLLMGKGEVVGCGVRHVTGAEVRRALAVHQVDVREYEWYVRMKDWCPLPTGGFGLGLERFLLWALRQDDVRDLHVMPRIKGAASWI